MPEGSHSLDTLRIGFIGAGRLGKTLAWSFAQRGLQVAAVASTTRASAESLAAPIAGCAVAGLQEVVDACDLVFVTTPDGAIAASVALARWRTGVAAVHCSGVTEVAALDKAALEGAMVGGFHPLQTFGDPAAAVRSMAGCTITIEAEEPLNTTLVALAGRLECNVNRLPPGMRGRYHAAAGYMSQFINALLGETSKIWQSWGATEAEMMRALLPLARGTLASIESAGIAAGMPGPVSRGDVGSVAKHVTALSEFDQATLELYVQLCERTVVLAVQQNAIPAETAVRLREVLRRG